MTVFQKILFSFLLSALLCAGIAALSLTGIFGNYEGITGKPAEIVVLVAVFLTLFLIIFFCFNLRRDSAGEVLLPDSQTEKTPELDADTVSADFMSAEVVPVESVAGLGGNFFMFSRPFALAPGNPELLPGAENVVYEENGIHYINNNVFDDGEKETELDRNFATLVESVVNNKEFESL